MKKTTKKKSKYTKSGKSRKNKPSGKLFHYLFIGGLVFAGFAMVFISGLYLLVRMGSFGSLPDVASLKKIENHNSSEIYASGGELLGKFFIYDRTSIGLQEISPHVVNALIATEDVRFYEHKGTDFRSMGRVVIKNLILGNRAAGGGSTINRQLTKNLFPRERTGLKGLVIEKIKEGIIARRLEKAFTKDEILLLYLNTVPFGENVFGISAASQRFFNKHPRLLATQEAATLVGMLKATTTYNPRINPENSLNRRNVVLGQMKKYNYLPTEITDSLTELPLKIDYSPLTHIHGPAPYFREMLRTSLSRWLNDYNSTHQTSYNLYTDGLKIFTTIDFNLQLMAEQALREELSRLQRAVDKHYINLNASRIQPLINREMHRASRYNSLMKAGLSENEIRKNFETPVSMSFFSWDEEQIKHLSPLDSILKSQTILHAGLLSLEPSTGNVRAWVGGNHFRYFQFDHVRSLRQAGSAFKPFVYAAALEAGYDPCEFISNEEFLLEEFDNWAPSNNDGNYEGYYSMKGAMTHSVNTVSSRYILRTGFQPVIELAGNAGITSSLPEVPSLALGSGEVTMIDLAAAYGIFANNGHNVVPRHLIRIEDSEGNILYQNESAPDLQEVISQETALIMTDILKSVVDQGTAASLRGAMGLNYDMAGKTGTTTNNADGWFVGYTPGLVTAVWTGLENPVFAASYPLPFGASGSAVPFWGNYIAKAGKNHDTKHYIEGSFERLPDHLAEKLDCPLFLEELDQPSWLQRLFGTPDPSREQKEVIPRKREEQPERRNRLRRWINEIF